MNSLDVVRKLRYDLSDERGGQTLLLKLLEAKKVKTSIRKAIRKEKELEKITQFIWDASWVAGRFINGKNEKVEISEKVRLKLIECVRYIDNYFDFRDIISFKIGKGHRKDWRLYVLHWSFK